MGLFFQAAKQKGTTAQGLQVLCTNSHVKLVFFVFEAVMLSDCV